MTRDIESSVPAREDEAAMEQDALRADLYRLLARLIREPADAPLLAWLADHQSDDGIATHQDPVVSALIALARAAAAASPEELERAHFRHLVGVIQGEVTPYASWYRHGELMEQALVALRADLRRLGFTRSDNSHDPEDHLAAMLEVMAMLVEEQSPEAGGFFMSHLAPWAERCLDDLARVDTLFYARTGELGKTFIAEEHSQLAAEAERSPVRIIEP
ncbi:TorD/DmsD family molecular chaperone [Halomonas icarae]|nr:molecular chaperone TorD family protein [Halomonas icarae]MDR5902075.1 molecular chaperone TorD family protein [Halomonas icarae]